MVHSTDVWTGVRVSRRIGGPVYLWAKTKKIRNDPQFFLSLAERIDHLQSYNRPREGCWGFSTKDKAGQEHPCGAMHSKILIKDDWLHEKVSVRFVLVDIQSQSCDQRFINSFFLSVRSRMVLVVVTNLVHKKSARRSKRGAQTEVRYQWGLCWRLHLCRCNVPEGPLPPLVLSHLCVKQLELAFCTNPS